MVLAPEYRPHGAVDAVSLRSAHLPASFASAGGAVLDFAFTLPSQPSAFARLVQTSLGTLTCRSSSCSTVPRHSSVPSSRTSRERSLPGPSPRVSIPPQPTEYSSKPTSILLPLKPLNNSGRDDSPEHGRNRRHRGATAGRPTRGRSSADVRWPSPFRNRGSIEMNFHPSDWTTPERWSNGSVRASGAELMTAETDDSASAR